MIQQIIGIAVSGVFIAWAGLTDNIAVAICGGFLFLGNVIAFYADRFIEGGKK